MTKHNISNPATFQPCEFSYLGAMAGLLQASGIPCDIVDVGGYSGYTFFMKVTEGWTDPGSPSLHSGNVKRVPEAVLSLWSDFRTGTESLGVQLECVWDSEQYEFWDDSKRARNQERALHFFERVKQEINADRPVVVWGLFVPDYGLVNGYTEDSYLVSTFRPLIGQSDEPVRYDQLQAKGGLEAIFVTKVNPMLGLSKTKDQLALKRAVLMAEGSPYTFSFETPGHAIRDHQQYITGLAAYDEWARVLEQYREKTIQYDYLSYIVACANEQKQIAGQFLRRLTERYRDRPQGEVLSQAAAEYEKAAAELNEVSVLFPFAENGDTSAPRCAQAAKFLRAAKTFEQLAIDHMKQAVSVWA